MTTQKLASGVAVSGYAAGFVPLPLAVTGWLMFRADDAVAAGSTNIFWVLIAAVPAALALGPLNCRRALLAVGDAYADRTARLAVGFGVLGLLLMVVPFGFLLYLGWVGLIADIALVGVTVPSLARHMVAARLESERLARKARRNT